MCVLYGIGLPIRTGKWREWCIDGKNRVSQTAYHIGRAGIDINVFIITSLPLLL